jgi:hypothetical protein
MERQSVFGSFDDGIVDELVDEVDDDDDDEGDWSHFQGFSDGNEILMSAGKILFSLNMANFG